jgi:hypothetical protein
MTKIQPDALLADEALYEAARDEATAAEWTALHELLATQAEITHALLRVVLGGLGAKSNDVPPPLRIPRPGDEKQAPRRMRPLDAAAAMRK